MFKLVILLDCDECGQSFHKGNVFEREPGDDEANVPVTTEEAMRSLEEYSEVYGWRVMRHYCICPECVLEEERMADWLQEPEEPQELI